MKKAMKNSKKAVKKIAITNSLRKSVLSLFSAVMLLTAVMTVLTAAAPSAFATQESMISGENSWEKSYRSSMPVIESNTETVETLSEEKYTDPDMDISFVIPEYWQREEFNSPKSFLRFKLQRGDNADLLIMYGATDLYAAAAAADSRLKRSDLGMDYFGEQEMENLIQAIAGTDSALSTVDIDGREYIRFETRTTMEILGVEITSVMTNYYTLENGYLVSFQFSDTCESDYFPEFLALLESVEIG